MRTGKCLPVTATEVTGTLLRSSQRVFEPLEAMAANRLRFRLNPGLVIGLGARTKRPGEQTVGEDIELRAVERPHDELTAYERLFGDALVGDASLFARQDAVEAAWAIVDLVRAAPPDPHPYAPGNWGPAEGDALAVPFGGWRDPVPGHRAGSGAPSTVTGGTRRTQGPPPTPSAA